MDSAKAICISTVINTAKLFWVHLAINTSVSFFFLFPYKIFFSLVKMVSSETYTNIILGPPLFIPK